MGSSNLQDQAGHHNGSSAIEIVTLVVILGLLAAVAFPIFDRMRENHQNTRFHNEIKKVSEAFSIYATENESYPEALGPGTPPEGIADYLNNFNWGDPTPFGGEWEWVSGRHGVKAAIAVLDPDVSEDHLRRFDKSYDNGDLETGQFRFISEIRYALVLEETQGESEDDAERSGDEENATEE